MKDGLNGDAKLLERYRERSKTERIAQAAAALFQELPPNVRSVLSKGFGRKIRDLFKSESLLRDVDWFERDGSRQEMRPVIEELLGRL